MPTEAEIAAAAAANTAKPWHDGFDPDTLGYMQNRGLDKKDAKTAFSETVKAHQEAQKKVTEITGANAKDIVIVPPDNAPPEAKKAFWERLGAPKDAKDYDFKDVKRSDGKPLDEKFQDFLRNVAGSAFLPKDKALDLAKGFAKFQDAVDAQSAAEKASTTATEAAALKGSWGAKYDANMYIAGLAAAKLGFTPAQVKVMESSAGYAATMEAFRRMGEATGEGRFLNNELGPDNSSVMTKEAAESAKKELMADKTFTAKLVAGDAEAKKKMHDLNLIISGVLKAA